MTQEKGHPDNQWMQSSDEELLQHLIPLRARELPATTSSGDPPPSKQKISRVVKGSFEWYTYSLKETASITTQLNVLRKMESETEIQEAWVEALEKRANVEKRLRKFKPPDPAEPGVAKWLAVPIAQIFLSEDQREEWLGDLREENRKLMCDGYPNWMLNLISIGKIARLLKSSIAIKIVDFILKLQGKV